MKKQKVGVLLKEMRSKQTQEQLAMDLNVARETVSKYENERSKVPPDISRSLMERYDNPKFAITIRNDYTGTGPVWLDGPNVDLHRSSVKEKVLEEMKEAMEKMESFCMSKPLNRLEHYEFQEMESLIEESIEAMTALEHMVAVVCQEANISYREVWQRHYKFLASKGYTGGIRN